MTLTAGVDIYYKGRLPIYCNNAKFYKISSYILFHSQDDLCGCLMDTPSNGILQAVHWVAEHYKSGTPITLLNRPIPKLKDADSWKIWKRRLLYYYKRPSLYDSSVFLYCATKHFWIKWRLTHFWIVTNRKWTEASWWTTNLHKALLLVTLFGISFDLGCDFSVILWFRATLSHACNCMAPFRPGNRSDEDLHHKHAL